MPTTRPNHSAVPLLLLALVDLAGASPPSIEAGHYEGLVDPAHPIGTLQGIAMDLSLGGFQGDVPFSRIEFIGETTSGEWKVIRINSIKWDRYSRPGDLKVVFSPNDQTKKALLRIFDILSSPGPVRMSNSWRIKLCVVAGSCYIFVGGSAQATRYTFIHPLLLLLLERVEERISKPTPTSSSQARDRGAITSGRATVLSTFNPSTASTTYFTFSKATEDTPPSNVLILPLMPLVRKGCGADCYIFAGPTEPADQAEVETSLTAACWAFGINNFTLGSIRLHRFGMDGRHFELLLGTEESDPAKPELRIRRVHPTLLLLIPRE
ncbi:hypothetical protein FOZ63_009135 [Perkinsus olseni]|uniref:Uncharacterized protein n=1 Tax=Perkinsus olseni TaxID=32597 RepID=A0A7J6UM24_PEROL|nr:hypothetical protein FOZ63_009135 [Perkinsus olseni]